MDTGIEGVQMDVRQLTEERDNIRSTYNDLTRKLIRVQVRVRQYVLAPSRQLWMAHFAALFPHFEVTLLLIISLARSLKVRK